MAKVAKKPEMSSIVKMTVSEDELRVNKLGYDNLSDKSTTMAHQIQDIETRLASLESKMISLSSRVERVDGRKYE